MNRDITLIFGRTGSGKSYLTKKLIKDLNRVIIIDALNEYTDGIIFYSLKDFALFIYENNPDKFKIILRLHNLDLQKDISLTVDKVFDLCFHIGNLTLVIEEAEIYISQYEKKSVFNNLIRYGRHKEISLIAVARRVTELSNDLKSQVNKIYSFNQVLKNDIIYLNNLGFVKVDKLKKYDFELVEY